MSAKSEISVICPKCRTNFSPILFQSVWGEYERYREIIYSNKINLAQCPSCGNEFKVESSLFYNDTEIQFAVWWEPKPDPEIDVCVEGWTKLYGANFYMVTADRVRSWEEFKSSIQHSYQVQPKIKAQPTVNFDHIQHYSKSCPQEPRLRSSSNDVVFWKITSIVLFLALIALTTAHLKFIKPAKYYPRGDYTLADQELLAENYWFGEGKVINYEKAYFWTLIAVANGSYKDGRISYIEEKITPSRIRTIQDTADKWHRKHKK